MYSHVQAKVYFVKFILKQTGLFSISTVSWSVSCLSLKLKPFLRNAITKWTTAWNKIELACHVHKNHLDTTKNEHGTFTGLVWISTVTLYYLANQLVLQAFSLQAVRLNINVYRHNINKTTIIFKVQTDVISRRVYFAAASCIACVQTISAEIQTSARRLHRM